MTVQFYKVTQLIRMNKLSDFRTLAQETEGDKELSPEDSEYLMALFGTFPPDAEI